MAGCCENGNEPFGYTKRRAICCAAKRLLATVDGLLFMEIISLIYCMEESVCEL